ncbi:MAG: hypothetical protein JXB05_24990 [Myxococcaceae bacterium]|nr:hypothetical protein [Myxococcaceae bacterium]
MEVVQQGDVVKARVCCGPCAQKRRACGEVVVTRFRVKVPRGAELNLSSVEAEVKVAGVEGEQEISTVSAEVVLVPRSVGDPRDCSEHRER